MAKSKINLPNSINDSEIRILWYNIKNFCEIATDLEEAILASQEQDKSLSQNQQNIINFIKFFNQQIDQFHYNTQPKQSEVQQYWLNFLSRLIMEFKSGKITEEEAKALIKKECIYFFQTDDEDYRLIDQELDEKKLSIEQYKKKLMEKITENEFRKDGPEEKYPYLVSEKFKNREIDIFIDEAWNKRKKKNNTNQGPKEEAKFILSYILKGGVSKRQSYPIYFHNEQHIDELKVFARLSREFYVPISSIKKGF